MSKDNKIQKKLNEKKDINKEDLNKEPMSKFEKIFVSCVLGLGLIFLIIVIIVSIGTGGDKNIIARKFPTLDKDNVFELVEIKDVKQKINNKENFQLLLINKYQEDADYYIYCVDDIIKDLNKSYDRNDVIYVLDSSYLKDEDIDYFRRDLDLEKAIIENPSLIYFAYDEKVVNNEHSVDRNSTDRYNVDKFENNYFNLLVKYFYDSYELIKNS